MKINEFMQKSNLTAQGLSELSGVSKRTIEQYTSDRRKLANAKACIVIALAEALQVHPKELID